MPAFELRCPKKFDLHAVTWAPRTASSKGTVRFLNHELSWLKSRNPETRMPRRSLAARPRA
jgi:hypothetical protein